MKKILIATFSLGEGGAEKVLVELLDNINYNEYEVDLFVIKQEGIYIKNINPKVNVKILFNKIKFSNRKYNNFLNEIRLKSVQVFSKLIRAFIINKKYDIEISFLEGIATKFISDSCNKSSKKIAWVHTDLEKCRAMNKFFEKISYPKFDKIVCVSNEAKSIFDKLNPKLAPKSVILYNIINKKKIIEMAEVQIDLFENKEIKTIIAIGRLCENKRFDILINAHYRLLKQGIENRVLILGEGKGRQALEKQIRDLKLEKSVNLIGFKENPYPYLKAADIFVSVSDYEGFSLVVCEAMILKKPIISTKCTGPNEILSYGKYGVLIECNNVEQLEEELKKMIIHDEVRKEYSMKSACRGELFEISEFMSEFYKIIN